ncbi:MAG TPA: hypothetical protein VH442_18085 [Micromonosporaceae bacterium]
MFLDAMPEDVARQRDILRRMLEVFDDEPALRWFELGCSLGRGAGDALSDIDCGAGVADGRWDDALALGARLASVGGRIADDMRQVFPGRDGATCWHLFTLYEDGAQLSLVLMPASWRTGVPPGSVVLHDADGRPTTPVRPPSADADPATLREWAALGWIALGDLAKYLDRGSLWEAYQRLDHARGELFKLWAAADSVDFPGYGLTAILDTEGATLPPGIEATVAAIDAGGLHRAALAVADLLTLAVDRLAPTLADAGLSPPDGLRAWVLQRLIA